MISEMIDLINVSFGYPGHADLYSGLNLSLQKGNIYGLLGRNGSGKSTLLYLTCGLLRPRRGKAYFLGDDTSRRLPQSLANMFILPEELAHPRCSFRKYVGRLAPFYPRFSEEALKACLDEFDMPADMPMGELSMGNKKKAYICFALATNVSLLLLDEPTNGLDIPSKAQFRRAVARTMTDDKSVVISTHQVRDIDVLLDHILIIDNGRVALNSSTADILSRYAFEERTMGEDISDALYAMRSIGGNKVVVENKAGVDTQLDLEVLFDAVVSGNIKDFPTDGAHNSADGNANA